MPCIEAGTTVGGQRLRDDVQGSKKAVRLFEHEPLDVPGGAGEAAHHSERREYGLDERRLAVELARYDAQRFKLLAVCTLVTSSGWRRSRCSGALMPGSIMTGCLLPSLAAWYLAPQSSA